MLDWTELIIGGVPLAVLVVGLVEFAKQVGFPAKYAPYLNGALAALGFVVITWAIPTYPQIVPILEVVAGAALVFLTASGIHQARKTNS